MKRHINIKRDWGVWGVFFLLCIGAQRADAKEDDEYNFNWLDPEKKIYVLQNRKYTKSRRLLVSGMVGAGFSNPYKTTYNVDPRIAYYVNENWGVEVFYTFTFNKSNSTLQALLNSSQSIPIIREIRSQYGAVIHWSPWYAKINVFNKILYFDWYFTLGGGAVHTALDTRTDRNFPTNYAFEDNFGIFFGTGNQFYFSDSIVIRWDMTGTYYRAKLFGLSGDATWFSNYNFGIGVGFRL